MKKLIIGLAAVGAVLALRPAVKRRMVQKMGEHCGRMMAQFAGSTEATGDEAMGQRMREHCGQMAARRTERTERTEPVATA